MAARPSHPSRPTPVQRRSSRMVGGFEPGSDIRDDISVAGSEHDAKSTNQAMENDDSMGEDSSSLLPPQLDMPSSLQEESLVHQTAVSRRRYDDEPAVTNTVLEEEEMKQKLADVESSFLPEPSAMSDQVDGSGASMPADGFSSDHHDSETSGGGVPMSDHTQHESTISGVPYQNHHHHHHQQQQQQQQQQPLHSPTTAGYKTPPNEDDPRPSPTHDAQTTPLAADHERSREMPNTSALETMSSSPTAARTVSRVQSLASLAGYVTAAERDEPESPTARKRGRSAAASARASSPPSMDPDATPRKDPSKDYGDASAGTMDPPIAIRVDVQDYDAVPLNVTRRRPQFLNKRSSNARLSYDSMASSTTETSEATLGADFALQSGGAAPESMRLRRKGNLSLSRSTSLGSLASGVSNISDDEDKLSRRPAAGVAPELSTLEEESPSLARRTGSASPGAMVTPRASNVKLMMPTDSVIARHVHDLEVPDTVARKFHDERSRSPDKNLSMATMTPAPKRGLTLKEHRSTVEKLGKENFDLKMKIHFLDQALQKRSEDGIKEMITENVQLKSDRLRLEKDNHNLRKQVRDLQRKLDAATGNNDGDDQGYATDEERSPTMEEEVLYLRERVEMTEMEMDKLRQDNVHKEGEKRRLAEMVRNLGDSRAGASEVGSREERDMWKDMLEAETIAREQAEEDARKLREEMAKIKSDASRPGSKLRVVKGQVVSRSSSVDGAQNKVDLAELDRLRHECSELQKTIGAQASALTSRNKEKEMLYQEIENLKLGKMGGLRSVAGDSIFERSASRARSNSRASNGTRYTRLSDTERENMENRVDQLRDEVSQLKLEKQHLQTQFDEALAELDAVDAQAQADADVFNEELALLTQERDHAMKDAEEQDQAFQQLKNEAQEEIDGLGDELDAKIEECTRLAQELHARDEMVKALQAEMRSAAEGLQRLEDDARQNLAKYQSVQAELDDSNRELENLEKSLAETQSKSERLRVQQESSRNEIAFLREEQDADKIKIGDLESLLKKTHLNLDAERDRAREFERRLTEERAQREAVAGQEKQEIQRTINELNREASSSKNELRQARKALSAREVELHNVNDRLSQLEDSLRHMLHAPDATSSHLVGAVSKLVKELDQATLDLDGTRDRLDEHKRLLEQRDGLLEDAAFEQRRLEDMIEREQLNRRQDKHDFEQALKSHEQASRLASHTHTRIAELEQARNAHRKQLATLEAQFKDQLAERNQVLLTVWRKLSAMCGPDWAHNHSLINGNLPSQEVIGNILFWPGFSRNLLLAARQVEGVLSGFKDKIRTIERDLHRNYTALEKEFDTRNKKLERIEEQWEKIKLREREIEAGLATSHGPRFTHHADVQKLRNENKLLKAELRLLQDYSHNTHSHHFRSHANTSMSHRTESRSSNFSGGQMSQHDGPAAMDAASLNGGAGIPNRGSSMRTTPRKNQSVTLVRHNSTGAVETLGGSEEKSTRSNSVTSGRNSGFGFTIGNTGTASATAAPPSHDPNTSRSREDVRRSLIQYPPSGTASGPPVALTHASDIAVPPTGPKADEKKWIHRLRELERRLKNEREQRLVDRDGARRRLEERDEANRRLERELERERAGRGWKADHAHSRDKSSGSGYLVADEPMLEEFVGQMNRAPSAAEEMHQHPPFASSGEGDEDDEALKTSEEERLMAEADLQAQPPGVGSSHAQRAAMQRWKLANVASARRPDTAPTSGRAVSRGSIMSTVMSPRRPGSIREKMIGGAGSRANSLHSGSEYGVEYMKTGERWGRNGCDKEVPVPFLSREGSQQSSHHSGGAQDGGQDGGMRKIMRTASAMAGVS